jgi:hypothetical protein
MNGKQTFTAEILPGRGGGAFAEVPFDVEALYGAKQVPVVATIGKESYRVKLMRMGRPCHIVPVPKDVRLKLGKNYGDTVTISVVPDAEPRPEIVTPADLRRAFKTEKAAQGFFDGLSYTHRKEYVRWIEDAKKVETRAARVAKTIEMLKAGKKGV